MAGGDPHCFAVFLLALNSRVAMDLPIVQVTRATSLAQFEKLAIASLKKVVRLQNSDIDVLGRKCKLFEHPAFLAVTTHPVAYTDGTTNGT